MRRIVDEDVDAAELGYGFVDNGSRFAPRTKRRLLQDRKSFAPTTLSK